MPNNLRLDYKTFQEDYETVINLKNLEHTKINKPDHACQEGEGYNWNTCLDKMLYTRKGCQDTWNYNEG